MKKALFLATLALVSCFGIGCSTPPRRIQAGGNEALTTMGINIQDFKRVASSLTQAMLRNSEITQFEAKHGRKPKIAVGTITRNVTGRIDFAQIEGRINEDLLNSGLVHIVAVDATSIARNKEQSFMKGEAVNMSHVADFYLEGTITEKTDVYDGIGEKNYTFQLRLNTNDRLTVFSKTEDVAKQGDKGHMHSTW